MKRVQHISGLGALVMITIPALVFPVFPDSTPGFIRDVEGREPRALPGLSGPGDLIDESWYARVSGAIEDHLPGKELALKIRPALASDVFDPGWLGVSRTDQVLEGAEDWLFYVPSLGSGYPEDTREVLSRAGSWIDDASRRGSVCVFIVPDKATVYPEMLGDRARELFQQTGDLRTALGSWCASTPHVVDVHGPMAELKARSEEPVYEPGGSHFSSWGSMVLARLIVERAAPGSWDPGWVVRLRSRERVPELARLAWIWDRTDSFEDYGILRDGVERLSTRIDGRDLDAPQDLDDLPRTQALPARFVSSGPGLIGGRTLIVHDSFVGLYLRPALGACFEDVSFVHIDDLSSEGLSGALGAYDRVVIECVERLWIERARRLMWEGWPRDPDPDETQALLEHGRDP